MLTSFSLELSSSQPTGAAAMLGMRELSLISRTFIAIAAEWVQYRVASLDPIQNDAGCLVIAAGWRG